jgi:hypothetical protein
MVSGEAAARPEEPPDSMPGMHHHASKPDSSRATAQSGASASMEQGSHDLPGHDANNPSAHSHEMSEGMLKVERQHFWFTVVGLAVALFKFVSDGGLWRRSLVLHLWSGCVTFLGVLLVFYTE